MSLFIKQYTLALNLRARSFSAFTIFKLFQTLYLVLQKRSVRREKNIKPLTSVYVSVGNFMKQRRDLDRLISLQDSLLFKKNDNLFRTNQHIYFYLSIYFTLNYILSTLDLASCLFVILIPVSSKKQYPNLSNPVPNYHLYFKSLKKKKKPSKCVPPTSLIVL